jgi:hypothetical protein
MTVGVARPLACPRPGSPASVPAHRAVTGVTCPRAGRPITDGNG